MFSLKHCQTLVPEQGMWVVGVRNVANPQGQPPCQLPSVYQPLPQMKNRAKWKTGEREREGERKGGREGEREREIL